LEVKKAIGFLYDWGSPQSKKGSVSAQAGALLLILEIIAKIS